MKYLTGLLLLVLMQAASATECRVSGGVWRDVERFNTIIQVSVRADPGTGVVLLDGYTLECRSGLAGGIYTQRIYTLPNGIQFQPPYNTFEAGMRFPNVDRPTPIPGEIEISSQTTEPLVSLPERFYLKIKQAPGKVINIKRGDHLVTFLYSVRTYDWTGEIKRHTMLGSLIAANALDLSAATCTFNNISLLVADFDSVDPSVVGENPGTAPDKITRHLRYSCPDAGITSPLDITLRGAKSSFTSNGIATSNPDLAVVMTVRGNVLVPPDTSFRTSVTNSAGGDDYTFALIRKPGSFPAGGDFSGSATLVMSVP